MRQGRQIEFSRDASTGVLIIPSWLERIAGRRRN